MRALIVGSVVAVALGVAAGSNLKLGVHADAPDLQGAADTLASFAAPPAEAAEVADTGDQVAAPSPILYVKYDGRWVSEDERAADEADAQNQAALQAQAAADDARVAGAAQNIADRPAGPLMPAPDRNRGGEPTDPPPPPLIVSLNQP